MFETTVLNGLPVTVIVEDRDWYISQVAGRRTNANWIYKRMGKKGVDEMDEQVREYRRG